MYIGACWLFYITCTHLKTLLTQSVHTYIQTQLLFVYFVISVFPFISSFDKGFHHIGSAFCGSNHQWGPVFLQFIFQHKYSFTCLQTMHYTLLISLPDCRALCWLPSLRGVQPNQCCRPDRLASVVSIDPANYINHS